MVHLDNATAASHQQHLSTYRTEGLSHPLQSPKLQNLYFTLVTDTTDSVVGQQWCIQRFYGHSESLFKLALSRSSIYVERKTRWEFEMFLIVYKSPEDSLRRKMQCNFQHRLYGKLRQ